MDRNFQGRMILEAWLVWPLASFQELSHIVGKTELETVQLETLWFQANLVEQPKDQDQVTEKALVTQQIADDEIYR